jgi:membrane protease YdiL (CAAX protease family)
VDKSSSGLVNRDFLELAVGYGLILIAVWSPLPVQRVLFWVTFSWILSTTVLSHADRETLGLGLRGIHRSLWVVGIAVMVALIQIVISLQFSALHPMYGPVPVGRHMWGYVIWSFLQQFILQDFFLLRLLRLMPSPRSAIITAASMFAIAHVPNPLLTIATLVWGLVACTVFLKYRSIYALGLVHAILGLCIAVSVPNAIHHHMRVGLGYLQYNLEQANRADASKPHSSGVPGGSLDQPATLRQQ